MHREDITAREAFTLLVRTARETDNTVTDVAAWLTDSYNTVEHTPSSPFEL